MDARGERAGDQLLLGVAREGADAHAEARVSPADEQPTIEPVHGTTAAQVAGWRCERAPAAQDAAHIFEFTIPAQALGVTTLSAGVRLLLAVQYVDDDADGFPTVVHTWGGGLEGSRATNDYRWIALQESGR